MIGDHDIVSVSHIYKDINSCVDALAKMEYLIDDSLVFSEVLIEIADFMESDKSSIVAFLEAMWVVVFVFGLRPSL